MANLTTVLETQKMLESVLFKKIADFENQLKATTSNVQPDTIDLPKLRSDFDAFQNLVSSALNLLREQITECVKTVDVIEMRHRRKYLLIKGIPEHIEGNLCSHIVKLFEDKLGLTNITADKITVCHRLGKRLDEKCRPVLMRFTDLTLKSMVWRKKIGFKGSQYVISEFLTPLRQTWFMQARERLGTRNCWTVDGNIFGKLHDGTLCRIASEKDLQDLPESDRSCHVNIAEVKLQPSLVATNTSVDENTRPKRAIKFKK